MYYESLLLLSRGYLIGLKQLTIELVYWITLKIHEVSDFSDLQFLEKNARTHLQTTKTLCKLWIMNG